MKLVNLEDVQKIISSYNRYQELTDILTREINSLPTYDPEKVLKEMIEEYKLERKEASQKFPTNDNHFDYKTWIIDWLENFLSRITK